MNNSRHIFMRCLLILSLLILPSQMAWSMASMESCGASNSFDGGVFAQGVDTPNCVNHEDSMNMDNHNDQDCTDGQCLDCPYTLSAVMSSDYEISTFSSTDFKNNLISILPFLDSPPPIAS